MNNLNKLIKKVKLNKNEVLTCGEFTQRNITKLLYTINKIKKIIAYYVQENEKLEADGKKLNEEYSTLKISNIELIYNKISSKLELKLNEKYINININGDNSNFKKTYEDRYYNIYINDGELYIGDYNGDYFNKFITVLKSVKYNDYFKVVDEKNSATAEKLYEKVKEIEKEEFKIKNENYNEILEILFKNEIHLNSIEEINKKLNNWNLNEFKEDIIEFKKINERTNKEEDEEILREEMNMEKIAKNNIEEFINN